MDYLRYLCLEFVMLSRLYVAPLWSPAWKELTSWLLFVMSSCDLLTLPCGNLVQVWYLITLIPDLFHLSYFCLDINTFYHRDIYIGNDVLGTIMCI